MRIIVTDISPIWNHNNLALEQFKDMVLVVCLNGEKVTDQYKCFVTPYKSVGLGADEYGIDSSKYRALEYVGEELNQELGYHENVLFLTDYSLESLYPYHVIKERNVHNRLHLCAVSPMGFERDKSINARKFLLYDFSKLTSILYIDSSKNIESIGKNITYPEFLEKFGEYYESLLPTVLNNIEGIRKQSYFDFSTNSYIPLEEGFNCIDISNIKTLDVIVDKELSRNYGLLGIVVGDFYPNNNTDTIRSVERMPSRIDGKRICNHLRNMRIELAKANNIDFISEECPSIGPCAGTCDKCDAEAAYLRDKLAEIPEDKRNIPDFEMTEWE